MSTIYPTDDSEEELLVPEEENIHFLQELPDGSSMYEIKEPENEEEVSEKMMAEGDFYRNLAPHFEEGALNLLAANLIDLINQDKESRSQWERTIDVGMKYLGLTVEEFRNTPFMRACAAFDATLATTLLNAYALVRAELLPAAGPARSEIIGVPTRDKEEQGERVKIFLNFFLTKIDKDYYPDFERLFMYVIFCGAAFKKVYMDPFVNQPRARLVRPQDLIIDNEAKSILSSSRITEVFYLTRKEILLKQQSGEFIEYEIPESASEEDSEESKIEKGIKRLSGIDTSGYENKNLFMFYECYTELTKEQLRKSSLIEYDDKKSSDIPKPYIVTICCATKKVVSIKRNWKEEDNQFNRIECFIHYYYLPSFGIYSFGICHLLCSNAITLTSIQRQLIDAGTLKNFPGGLKDKSFRAENNDVAVGPASFMEIETGSRPLRDGIMMMPYGEPSQVLATLRNELKQDTAALGTILDKTLPNLGANAPVGTTLIVTEIVDRLQSTALRSLNESLGKELQLIFKYFGEYLPDEPYPFSVPGKEYAIMKKDFNDNVNIVPVSDPNVLTTAHRLIRNESLIKLSQMAPQIHDMREGFYRMYSGMNVENIDKILPEPPKPKPEDPISENMNLLVGKPITIAMFQDDDSHIISHKNLSKDPTIQANPAIYSAIMSHIQRHEANKIFKQMHHEKQRKNIESHAIQRISEITQEVSQEARIKVSQGYPVHWAQHEANQKIMIARQNIQEKMQHFISNIQLPEISEEEAEKIPLLPEIQNALAQKQAQDILNEMQEQQKQEEEAKRAAENQIDPNKVMLADIEQRREASYLKDEETKLKAETEAFKAQLKYESDTARTESQKEIASEKNAVNMAIEKIKHPRQILES